MTNVFVASANERVIDGARRLLANELEGDELRSHLALEAIVPHMPIRTIAVKTWIAEALVARGLGPCSCGSLGATHAMGELLPRERAVLRSFPVA